MGHAKPLSDAALSSHITTDEEKIVARGLGESIRIGQEEKTPTVNEEAELKGTYQLLCHGIRDANVRPRTC